MSDEIDEKDEKILELRKRLRETEKERDKALTLLASSNMPINPRNLAFYRKFIPMDYVASWLSLPAAFYAENMFGNKAMDMVEDALQRSVLPGGIEWPLIDNKPLRFDWSYWLQIDGKDHVVKVSNISLCNDSKATTCHCIDTKADEDLGWHSYQELHGIDAYEAAKAPMRYAVMEAWDTVDEAATQYDIDIRGIRYLPAAFDKIIKDLAAQRRGDTDDNCTCGGHCGHCKNNNDDAPQGPTHVPVR